MSSLLSNAILQRVIKKKLDWGLTVKKDDGKGCVLTAYCIYSDLLYSEQSH